MCLLNLQAVPGNYQSEEHAIFAVLKKIERLQKEHAIYLRGSLAYYGILGFRSRHCHDIDLAASNPEEAANVLGLAVDTKEVDCIAGHIGYMLHGIQNVLSIEILRYLSDIKTVPVSFPHMASDKDQWAETDTAADCFCQVECISPEMILTEKLFSTAYALREKPFHEYSVRKNLFDLFQLFHHQRIHKFFPSRHSLYSYIETHLYIERDRKDRFISAGQMLDTLSRISDIAVCPLTSTDMQLLSAHGINNTENCCISGKAFWASLEEILQK